MVTRWGMSDKLGPLQYSEGEEEVFLGYSRSQNMHMSNETARAIDTEIRDIVEAGYDRAKYVLTENETQLHLLANALLEYETLSGEEIKALLDRSEEHTSELQSQMRKSYAVFCLKQKNIYEIRAEE